MTIIDGQFQKAPQDAALGPPPDRLSGDALQAWHDLVAAAEPGVLRNSDKLFLELFSQTLANARNAKATDLETLKLLREMCGNLLLTKQGRMQLAVPGL